ncbi:hypothetical protein OIU84_002324 [Salix udensis]|uniref:Gnk2-homologous domain-containing protein n=1 Tax=Salix udensis TaxID=889485 RepID=A0AAD6K3X9_9ROSI|nr:hypothetical protein OIU84_002324 [Salix udensis]
MGTIILVSLLFHILIVSISLISAEKCYDTGNFRPNSTYANNRDLLLSSLASNVTANGGFYNTTTGQYNDTVYALVLCISDPSAEDCASCVNSAIQELIVACPSQKEAISLYATQIDLFLGPWSYLPLITGPPPDFITSSPSPTNTTSTINEGKGNNSPRNLVAIIVPPIIFFAFVVLVCTFFYFRKPKQDVERK